MRVLLVEDNDILSRVLVRILENAGHTVTAAATADQATTRLLLGDYDVLLCDVMLPDSDGCALAKNVRRFAPTVIVLVLTGLGASEMQERPDCLGIPVLQKPFTGAELVRKLAEIGVA